MLTREENDLITRTGPGTPMGILMRRYWIPALFSDQLPSPDCPPVRVKLLGEKLVAFRTTDGNVGLVDERCPHRNASMFFGRNEENGLRCVYHGWKFDLEGRCIDMPSEPAESNFKRKVTIDAYPCVERGGMVWAYMGPPHLKPAFPAIEWTEVPASHRHATRHIQECNWFQGFEGGFDASHLTFLHRGDIIAGNIPLPKYYQPVPTGFGMLFGSGRESGGLLPNWIVEVMLMPFHKLIALQANRPRGAHIWVPMDDENCMIYSIEYRVERPLSHADIDRSLEWKYIHAENLPGSERCVSNRDNDYRIDRERQKSGASYTGFTGFGIQDCGIQESMGPISDRTREHLGTSDIHLIQLRRYMLRAIKTMEAGGDIPGSDPDGYRVRSSIVQLPAGRAFDESIATMVRAEVAPAALN
jgi:phenylpropionate dioxygenase-like ring-hydroxylating dioxygenase large terminal subunit